MQCHTKDLNVFLMYIFIIILCFIRLQALEFDREGLTKLKKAVKAIYNSGNCMCSFI